MNDLDDWLNSLGIDSTQETTAIAPVQSDAVAKQFQEEHPTSNISPDDFNDILADNGFQEPVYEEAEEVTDEDEEVEEYDENTVGGMDLDIEEHEDWNRQQEDALPPVQAEAIEAVQSVNEEDYPEHNPDEDTVYFHMPDGVVSVPIVHASESSQEVSDAAMEAFNTIAEQTTVAPPAHEVIPPNSPTLLLNNATSRFSGTEWYNEIQKQRIILAGCGGIGSWTILQLARMNPSALFMYDDDVVEQANMSGQLYCIDDIGKAKVDAMADMIKSYTTMRNIYAIKDKFTTNSEAGDIMICGFDNMEARRIFFVVWHNYVMTKPEEERHKCLYLDGRLSINTLQVFCITGDNDWAMKEYADKYLFTDAEAEETQCSLKQTTYLACMIGSMIVNLFTNFVANTLNPIIPYDLPFFTEYDAQNMIFKTIK